MNSLKTLILKNRSYRRFYHDVKIENNQLSDWIDLARNSAAAKNLQPLKYIVTTNEKDGQEIFKNLKWAGLLPDWDGPIPEERPVAYIIMMMDKNISTNLYCDHGIAAQSILLGAVEAGFGGCILAAIHKKNVSEYFQIPENLEIIQLIALGKPKEMVMLDEIGDNGETKYWRDEQSIHHVPKRKLEDIIWLNR